MNLNKRDQREILEYLELIREELTDAYHLTDKDGTEEAFCSIDTARDLVDELTYNIENPQEAPIPHEDMDREGGLMGPDGLPLVHIEPGQYFSGDGEGRLKGKN